MQEGEVVVNILGIERRVDGDAEGASVLMAPRLLVGLEVPIAATDNVVFGIQITINNCE